MRIEARLRELGIVLPEPFQRPTGRPYPFSWVRVRGDRASVSGHLPLAPDGSLAEPRGKVGAEVTPEQGAIGSLQRALGDLDRVTAWLRVFGMVNVAPGFTQVAGVVNGFSETLIEVFGPKVGGHARSAVGMAELPFGVAVEIEAEVEIGPA
jgi:enamine deaminase RidA (YjgF/YER057c/UK114 family)